MCFLRNIFCSQVRDAGTGELRSASWEEAIVAVAKALDSTPGDKIAAVAGGLADAEVKLHYFNRNHL